MVESKGDEMTVFCSLDNEGIAVAIRTARRRVILCTSGFTDPVAAALVAQTRSLGRDHVRAVVDASDGAARSGYGYFDAIKQAYDEGVDIRKEKGLRLSVLIVDDEGWCFALPPLMIEDVAEHAVAPNAVRLASSQVKELADSIVPSPVAGVSRPAVTPLSRAPDAPVVPPPPTSPIPQAIPSAPEIGKTPLQADEVAETVRRLEVNPPQKFDLARKVLVFNAYIEFIEIELLGTQIDRHRVQLPKDLILAASDKETRKRLQASFDLIKDTSLLKREADALRSKVDEVRTKMARSTGKRYGTILLRSHKEAIEKRILELQREVEAFKGNVFVRIGNELRSSRTQLVKSLVPIIRKNPPVELKFSVSGRLTNEIVAAYLERRLNDVFPKPEELISQMELTYSFKGVTYPTLNELDFQETVRRVYPHEDFDKPFEESIGVKASSTMRAASFGSNGSLL